MGLIDELLRLKKSDVSGVVDKRLAEFKRLGEGSNNDIFKELCFCILTANFNAEKSIIIQRELGDGFLFLSENELADKLRRLGHRYPNTRAKYIVYARRFKDSLRDVIGSLSGERLREWFVKYLKGLGYKEASHFLRNIGFEDYAIVDFHIVDLLVKHGLVVKPKTMTKMRYLEIERVLKVVAEKAGFTLAELDLYLWFMETGKVLK
ncbi:MAG TPA: N-glycosylase/DNA lyase [Thermoplasmatales archaeon]|nr:N-glycosylase/DNA lyase [Thermoplasmatales archaeon]